MEHLDQIPTYVQQLQFTVKNPTVGKAATFTKVDNVIQETKNLMNVISKVVTTCFVCATKVSAGMKLRGRFSLRKNIVIIIIINHYGLSFSFLFFSFFILFFLIPNSSSSFVIDTPLHSIFSNTSVWSTNVLPLIANSKVIFFSLIFPPTMCMDLWYEVQITLCGNSFLFYFSSLF